MLISTKRIKESKKKKFLKRANSKTKSKLIKKFSNFASKRLIFKNIKFNFKSFEFFNVICSNVFNKFLSVGQPKDIDLLMRKYLQDFEYIILSFLLKFEQGNLTTAECFKFLDDNIILKNIYFFLIFLKTSNWEQFCQFSERLNTTIKKKKISNIILTTLYSLRKIMHLKNLIKAYSDGSISEGHFELAIKNYKLDKNLASILSSQVIFNFFESFSKVDEIKLNLKTIFYSNTIGFYDAVIDKYSKHSFYSQVFSKDDLSLVLKKHRWIRLNQAKNRGKLSYIHSLALNYIGRPFQLAYAPKPINLRYRAYRIFLYAFKFKPFKLWQITRKSRDYKYGGLLVDHLSKYELTIQNILLMSNFCLSLFEFKEYLRKGYLCINSKIVSMHNFVVRPFDVIHFHDSVFRIERSKFLLKILSAKFNNIFNKEFSQLFEYNFKAFCFIMLPNFFKYRKLSLAPYYTIYNSGRFSIEKD